MGILITTQSLQEAKACSSSYAFVTGSLWTEGHQWYSGSNYEAYFEEGEIYPFTCSNSTEVSWVMWACDEFGVTGSLYNSETDVSQLYYKPMKFIF